MDLTSNSTFPNDNLLQKIKSVLAGDGTVLFIGSGISAWAGLPTWKHLIELLADYIEPKGQSLAVRMRELANDGQLTLAADIGYNFLNDLNPGLFQDFLQEALRIDTAVPSPVHQKLVELGVTCFITTNYDRLLEKVLEQNGPLDRFDVITNEDPIKCNDLIYCRKTHFVYKPHGDYASPTASFSASSITGTCMTAASNLTPTTLSNGF